MGKTEKIKRIVEWNIAVILSKSGKQPKEGFVSKIGRKPGKVWSGDGIPSIYLNFRQSEINRIARFTILFAPCVIIVAVV